MWAPRVCRIALRVWSVDVAVAANVLGSGSGSIDAAALGLRAVAASQVAAAPVVGGELPPVKPQQAPESSEHRRLPSREADAAQRDHRWQESPLGEAT